MSLKFPFKFIHSLSSTIYTAKLREGVDEIVDVYWVDDGITESTDYSLDYTIRNIQTGIWKNIEELKVDPLVEIRQSEYEEMVEEINLLRELLAEANHKLSQTLPKDFKPITEYTMSDWQQALEEGWVFKLRNGRAAAIISLDHGSTSYPVETQWEWLRLYGNAFTGVKSHYDIVERIK